MKVLHEIRKNFKIIFRSWTSVSLLILGPLLLILLIGYAFSGNSMHDIKIGIVTENYDSIGLFIQNLSDYSDFVKYKNETTCVNDMQLEKVHLCLKFSDDFITSKNKIPSGEITFYYDNTRDKLTADIITNIKGYLGVTAEQISVEATSTIFDNIQKLVLFLNERSSDIEELKNESLSLKEDLILRKQKLEELRNKFLPKYNSLKSFQTDINNLSSNLSSNINTLNNDITEIKTITSDIESYSSIISETLNAPKQVYISTSYASFELPLVEDYEIYNISELEILNITGNELILKIPDYELLNSTVSAADITNLTDEQVLGLLLSGLSQKLNNLDSSFTLITENLQTSKTEIDSLNSQYNDAMKDLDDINNLLNLEIKSTQEYIEKIDAANIRISEINSEMSEGLDKLSFINPELSEKLIKPIAQYFESVKQGLTSIQLVFPLLFSVIIIFISMLFANIVTLSEIHSKAFFRNLIAPVKDINYTVGLILTNYIVVLFQSIILTIVAQVGFEVNIFQNYFETFIIFSLLSTIFILLGMSYAYFFKNEQTSILITTFTALGFFLFSNVVTPLELMPKPAMFIAALNPIVISTKLFKEILIYNLPINLASYEIPVLIIYIIIMIYVVIYASNVSRNRR